MAVSLSTHELSDVKGAAPEENRGEDRLWTVRKTLRDDEGAQKMIQILVFEPTPPFRLDLVVWVLLRQPHNRIDSGKTGAIIGFSCIRTGGWRFACARSGTIRSLTWRPRSARKDRGLCGAVRRYLPRDDGPM